MAARHVWISGGSGASRAEAAARFAPDVSVDCHRRHRGPYTGTGSMLRHLVPLLCEADPTGVLPYAHVVLAAAPELEWLLGSIPGTLTSTAPPQERTRWYPKARTRRIAQGLIDMLRECAGDTPVTLHFDVVDHADATDLEFLALALARLDPARIRLVVSGGGEIRPDLDEGPSLTGVCAARCERMEIIVDIPDEGGSARDYIDSDCTSDSPATRAAYLRLDPDARARLHDTRAAALKQIGDVSLRLGAIPYHRARGTSVATGRMAYRAALTSCTNLGYYDAGLEHADHLLALIDQAVDPSEHHLTQMNRANLLLLMYRAAEAESIFYDVLAGSTVPYVHTTTTYGLAMLYTRMYGPEQKDHHRALAHINTAITIASQLADPAERAFQMAFMLNGKALVLMHLGRLQESLGLVTDALARLDEGIGPDHHHLHRSVLHHNLGQLYAGLGRDAEALAEFDHVISVDPSYPEFRFDRGNLLNKMGRHADALADYEAAERMGPPYPELFHNIGDLRAAMGDIGEAVTAFRRVLDLEPGYLDSRVSLATLLIEAGEPAAAAGEARAGLELAPDEPRLHCTLALAFIATGELDAAAAACDRALELAPDLVEALVNRSVVAYEQGRHGDAIDDLRAAHALDPDNADVLFNLEFALAGAAAV